MVYTYHYFRYALETVGIYVDRQAMLFRIAVIVIFRIRQIYLPDEIVVQDPGYQQQSVYVDTLATEQIVQRLTLAIDPAGKFSISHPARIEPAPYKIAYMYGLSHCQKKQTRTLTKLV